MYFHLIHGNCLLLNSVMEIFPNVIAEVLCKNNACLHSIISDRRSTIVIRDVLNIILPLFFRKLENPTWLS